MKTRVIGAITNHISKAHLVRKNHLCETFLGVDFHPIKYFFFQRVDTICYSSINNSKISMNIKFQSTSYLSLKVLKLIKNLTFRVKLGVNNQPRYRFFNSWKNGHLKFRTFIVLSCHLRKFSSAYIQNFYNQNLKSPKNLD